MPTAKKTTKKKSAKIFQYRPSNLATFVIVVLLVALGTVTWLFIQLAHASAGI